MIFSELEDPQTWNLYAYTANNPLSRVDPDGQDWFYQDGSVPVWLDCASDPACADKAPEGWTQWTPKGEGGKLKVDYLDGTFTLGVGEDGNPTSSYSVHGLEAVDGPVEGLATRWFGGLLARPTVAIGSAVLGVVHRHHTTPREILKQLPEQIANHPLVRGIRGFPNRWKIPGDLHKEIHKGAGGGAYNDAFKQKLRELGRPPTVNDVLQIRKEVTEMFGLASHRPKP